MGNVVWGAVVGIEKTSTRHKILCLFGALFRIPMTLVCSLCLIMSAHADMIKRWSGAGVGVGMLKGEGSLLNIIFG